MRPRVYRAHRIIDGAETAGWAVHFTPTDPDTSHLAYRDTWAQAIRLALRIARRQSRDRQWAAKAIAACTTD